MKLSHIQGLCCFHILIAGIRQTMYAVILDQHRHN
jgi:hypothetical protein